MKFRQFILHHWPVSIIILIWFVFSSPFFLKGLIPFPSDYLVTFFPPWNASYAMPVKNNAMPDVITQIYPWKKLTIDTWKSGSIPLWNPYSFSGTGHAANYQSAVFSPVQILFWLFSFNYAWTFLILLQPLLAGIFIYIYLHSLKLHQVASCISSVAWMFCGFMVTWMAYGTLGYAVLYLPLGLFGIQQYFLYKKYPYGILVSISVLLSLLSGHFQISVYVIGVLLVYALTEMIRQKDIQRGIRILLFLLMGILITAPQLLLTYQAFISSTRGSSIIKGEIIPWNYILTFLSPDFYGNPVTRNDWFGHYAEWSGYVGIIPLFFAIITFFNKKIGSNFYKILLIITLLLAYQSPFVNLLFALKIPVLSTSAASRIIVICSFSICILGAYGLHEFIIQQRFTNKFFVKYSSIWFFCFGIIWLLLHFFHIIPGQNIMIAKRNMILPSATLCLVIGSVMVYNWKSKMRTFLLSLLILLSCFSAYRFAQKWIPYEPEQYIYPATKLNDFLQTHVGYNRVFGNLGGEFGVTNHLQLIEGYDAMYNARYGEFMNAVATGNPSEGGRSVVLFDKYGIYKDRALQLLGVRYILQRLSDGKNIWAFPVWSYSPDSMKSIYRDEHYEVYEYTDAFPRTYLASVYKVAHDNKTISDLVLSTDTDLRSTVILEKEPIFKPESGEGEASIQLYTPNKVIIKTQASTPKILFLSDTYDSSWQVTIDNVKAELLRADYDFRAVSLPKGQHIVTFVYHPYGFYSGIFIACATIILCFVLIYKKIL